MRVGLLVYETSDGFMARSDAERHEAYWSGTMVYLKALRDAGIFVGGAGLEPPASARTLVSRDGKRQIQDGPFADTKEQLGGFFLIDVPSWEVALEWAGRFPRPDAASIEVRPVLPEDAG